MAKKEYEKYPLNLEFSHTYAHMLCLAESTLENKYKGIKLYKRYIEENKPHLAEETIKLAYNAEVVLFRHLQNSGKVEEAD
ncbi:hypothetical protein MACH09_41540 [Vibrio sp. MACH09]|uniref:hypothetical protein n=1 Tax=Vibrio sp. MACH09 TaxID=3025122 RepID=UPI002790DC51|nr:hypothetical protein [Vibrio sp. MACH09]GLO63646.1 hypothetical protein MACH09_41540 [Vibrio sp. MACH09]